MIDYKILFIVNWLILKELFDPSDLDLAKNKFNGFYVSLGC